MNTGIHRFLPIFAALNLMLSGLSSHATSLAVTAPEPGQKIPQNSDFTISWEATGIVGPVANIIITIVDGEGLEVKLPEVAASAGHVTYRLDNSGTFNGQEFEILDKQTGKKLAGGFPGTAKILLTGYWGYQGPQMFMGDSIDASPRRFEILNPSVAISSPVNGDVYRVGDIIPFRWKTDALNYPEVALRLSKDGGQSWISTGFYAHDTGAINLMVSREENGTISLVVPPTPGGDVVLVYFSDLQPSKTYSLRIGAGASEGYGEMLGTFAIVGSNSEVVRRQTIKCTAGVRIKRKILGVVGKTVVSGKLPGGLKYRPEIRSVMGRPKRSGIRRVQVTDSTGTKTLVLFKVRKARVAPKSPPFFF